MPGNLAGATAKAAADILPMQMKGVGFANVRGYVLATHDEARWQRVLECLQPTDREVIESAVAIGWYDVRVFARLLRTVDLVCGAGDLELLLDVGVYEAEQDFNRVLRIFLRAMTPLSIFRAEGRLWTHFQDTGTWSSSPVDGGVDATLRGWAVDAALCKELTGYLTRLLEFTGGRQVQVIHDVCCATGGDRCVFKYRWRE